MAGSIALYSAEKLFSLIFLIKIVLDTNMKITEI